MFLTDDISIAYRHTDIKGLWPLYAWWIDSLTLSACCGPGCKRHVVLVTHLFLSTVPKEGPSSQMVQAKICESIWMCIQIHIVRRLELYMYLCTPTQSKENIFFPGPQGQIRHSCDFGGHEALKGQTEQTLRELASGSQVTPSSPGGVKGHGSESHHDELTG